MKWLKRLVLGIAVMYFGYKTNNVVKQHGNNVRLGRT